MELKSLTHKISTYHVKGAEGLKYAFQEAKGIGIQLRITYTARLRIIHPSEKGIFNETEDVQAFLLKRPEMNRKFEIKIQVSRKA